MTGLQRWIVRPYLRRELPRWEILFDRFVKNSATDWSAEPRRWSRSKLHGYQMELNLASELDRYSYFLGRYYELSTQLLILESVRPGDRVVDIGVNIGEISLLFSKIVGADGVVDSFEPNPRCVKQLLTVLELNHIQNIRLHHKGLADVAGELTLAVPKHNSGEGSFAHGDDPTNNDQFETFQVPVAIADDELASDSRPISFIKIDVEGFEYHVLTGLSRTLSEHKPLVMTEILAQHLVRAGKTPADVFEYMIQGFGYEAYRFRGVRKRRAYGLSQNAQAWKQRYDLVLEPVDPAKPPSNVLWVPRAGANRDRLASRIPTPRKA